MREEQMREQRLLFCFKNIVFGCPGNSTVYSICTFIRKWDPVNKV